MEQVSQDRLECARRALLAALDSLSYDSPNDILISQSLQSTAMTGYYFEPQRERILALAQSYQRIMRASRGGLKGFIKELAYHRYIAYFAMKTQQQIGDVAVVILDYKPGYALDYKEHYEQRTTTAVYAAFNLVAAVARSRLYHSDLEADAQILENDGRNWERAFKATIFANSDPTFLQDWKTTVDRMLVPFYSDSESDAAEN